MALNRNNNFCADFVTSQSWSPRLCHVAFHKPLPLHVPSIMPALECQKLLVHQAAFKAPAVEAVAESFVALEADLKQSFIAYISLSSEDCG